MKKTDSEEFFAKLHSAFARREKRLLKGPLTWESLKEFFEDAESPKPVEEMVIIRREAPAVEPEYPKLLVHYAIKGEHRQTVEEEFVVIESEKEWKPFHTWFPRPLAEREWLATKGIPERVIDRTGAN